MPAIVKKIKNKYRVVDANTGKITKHPAGGAADGGGHKSKAAATRQMQAINISQARQRGVKIPKPKSSKKR